MGAIVSTHPGNPFCLSVLIDPISTNDSAAKRAMIPPIIHATKVETPSYPVALLIPSFLRNTPTPTTELSIITRAAQNPIFLFCLIFIDFS